MRARSKVHVPIFSSASLFAFFFTAAGALFFQAASCSAEHPKNTAPPPRTDIVIASSSEPAESSTAPPAPPSSEAPAERAAEPFTPDHARYPWLAEGALPKRRNAAEGTPLFFEPVASLFQRFSPPPGFTRVSVQPGSFGEWLRGLPLAKENSPVLTFRGDVLLPGNHENIAAVASLDVGPDDLQQCADSVIRLHAEWKWASGARDMSYKAAAGTPMPYARWMRGERIVQEGNAIRWKGNAKPDPEGRDHASFRQYLDSVFTWANTGALAMQASKIKFDEIRPGDFFILPGSPGHAVLVLDMAVNAQRKKMALLGQGYMPAQSFQVLRPSRAGLWFELDPAAGGVQTPFWPDPFPWDSLRRLD